MDQSEIDAKRLDVKIMRSVSVIVGAVCLTMIASCWVENHYRVRQIREAVHGGSKFEIRENNLTGTPTVDRKREEQK